MAAITSSHDSWVIFRLHLSGIGLYYKCKCDTWFILTIDQKISLYQFGKDTMNIMVRDFKHPSSPKEFNRI